MKPTKMSTILVLVLGLMVCQADLAKAAPMGTAWTYQGRLLDANDAADGLYDFQFRLFDDPNVIVGTQVGDTIDINELDVIDGYFTVGLDFNDANAFNGDARWLEIGVRPGELEDPNDYTTLSPRQEVTPTPYAIYAESAPAGHSLDAADGSPVDVLYVDNTGKVGIGTTTPSYQLEVKAPSNSALQLSTQSPNSHVDIRGIPTGSGNLRLNVAGGANAISFNVNNNEKVRMDSSGNVGIGTASPAYKLDVSGDIRSTGTIYGTVDNADKLDGLDSTAFATSGHNHDSLYVNTSGDSMSGSSSPWVLDVENTGTGSGIDGSVSGIQSIGVRGTSSGSNGVGVRGNSLGDGGYGVFGYATSETGRGVYGKASYGGDQYNYGGYFESASRYGAGVYGEASHSYGGYGVYGKAGGTYSIGVYGEAMGSGYGVCGWGNAYDFFAAGPGINYGASSSIRWKSDIRAIDEPLQKVLRLRGVYFNWDAEHGGGHDVGMIAEEVGEVLPEIVQYEENGIDASGMDYSKLTPLLVEAVKELKGENDRLKERVEALERTIHQLAKVKELEL